MDKCTQCGSRDWAKFCWTCVEEISRKSRTQAIDAATPSPPPGPSQGEGLTSKEAWWAGVRAGLGLPTDTPREEVAAMLSAAPSRPVVDEVEYEFEVWQDGSMQAGGSTTDYATAKDEADHYAMMYEQDRPVEVRMYEKRRIAALRQVEGL